MNRRDFLAAFLAFSAAPAIARASSIALPTLWEYGDMIRYEDFPPDGGPRLRCWVDEATMPAQARRDIDSRLDEMERAIGSPIFDRQYVWFPRWHRDMSDPMGTFAVVAAKGMSLGG